MKLIDEVWVQGPEGVGTVQLLVGDLARLPEQHAVDVLAVSAFPNAYNPLEGTLIGALDEVGVSVAALAAAKEHDLRDTASCWLSAPVGKPSFHARRIMCFEPRYRSLGAAADVVGDVFRSLVPFVSAEPWVRSVAMPLLASGHQGEPGRPMMEALVGAALHWMAAGLPLKTLKIVLYDGHDTDYVEQMAAVFRSAGNALPARPADSAPAASDYDVFLSYARKDEASARALAKRLQELAPALRIFVDRVELAAGSAWQQKIYDAVSSSRRIVCLYSPDYLTSKPCLEELNVGLLRNREEGAVLLPAYLRSADLPAYLRAIQYEDVREGEPDRVEALASALIRRLGVNPAGDWADSPSGAPREAARPGTPEVGTASATVAITPDALTALMKGDVELHIDVTVRLTPLE